MNQPSDRGSWRKSAGESRGRQGWRNAARDSSSRDSGRRWTQLRGSGLGRAAVQRLKLFAYGLSLIVLLLIFAAWMLFRPRPVPLMALAVLDYRSPIDPNALAAEDLQRFDAAFKQYRNIRASQAIEGRDGDWRTVLDRQLKQMRPGGPGNGRLFPDNDVLLLYISAHGAVDGKGQPCLLMHGSDPLDESTWVPVLDVIAHVNRHERLDRSRKLLILDSGRIRENWSCGILHNGFAEVLRQTLSEKRLPRLYVLNSTRRDERGCSAPELGGSVFAYYVACGLRGAADSDGDGRIKLRELYEYLQSHVASWVNRNRTQQQRPLLIPEDAEDFGLTYVTDYVKPPAAPIKPDADQKKSIDRLWVRYAALQRAGLYDRSPMDCAMIPAELARLESLVLAGGAYREQGRSTVTAIERSLTLAETDAAARRVTLDTASVILRQRLGLTTSAEVQAADTAFAAWRQSRGKPADAKQAAGPTAVAYPAAAAAVWRSLVEKPEGDLRQQITSGLEFLAKSQGRTERPCKEAALLGMMTGGLDWDAPGISPHRLIMAQEAAEQTAAPEDARVHYWIRAAADAAEQELRLARDEVFVGSAAALAAAEPRWAALIGQGTAGKYGEVRQAGQHVAQAYAARDEACSKLPFLAQWLLTYPELPDRSSLVQSLLQLIELNRELTAALDWRTSTSAGDVPDLTDKTRRLKGGIDQLLGRYSQVCADLAVAQAGQVRATLSRIARSLEIPLVSDQREDLRQKLFANLTAQGEDEDAGAPVSAATRDDELKWLTDLAVHPALALLDRSGVAPGDERVPTVRQFPKLELAGRPAETALRLRLLRLAEMGGEIRLRLAEIGKLRERLAADTDKALAAGTASTPREVRLGLSKADYLTRCAAAILRKRPWTSPDEDPGRKLRALDVSFWLLWQGQRVTDDFWGPWTGRSASFFSVSAREYLQAAGQFADATRAYQDRLAQELTRLDAATAAWRPVASADVEVVEGEAVVPHSIEWRGSGTLPAGESALFLRWTGGGLVPLLDVTTQAPLRRRSAEVGKESAAQKFEHLLSNKGDRQFTGIMEAVAFYRGHVRSASFYVGQGAPAATVEFQRPELGPPRIRVKGDSTQKTQIIFVLDCSGSMKEKIAVEGLQEMTRLQVARSRLLEVLDALDPESYQVGLILYGHRAGWEEYERGRYRPKWRSEDDKRRQLQPAEDVELVVPVRPMKFTEVGGAVRDVRDVIAARLDPLIPFGETPLYFAIIEALKNFNRELPGPRHVVVITDGVNEQTASGASREALKDRDSAQQTLQDPLTRAQIDIIGFGLKREFADEEERRKWVNGQADLVRIARDPLSGGDFHEARDPSSLLQKLRDSLRLVKYYVHREGAPAPSPDTFLSLNQPWTVKDFDGADWYSVELSGHDVPVSSRVFLEGGESLLLSFNRAADRLDHLRFEDELRESRPDLRDPAKPERRFFVGAHLPQRRGSNEVWFRVSVQNAAAEQFSQRPRRIWAEIRELPSRNRVFFIGDAEFEPDQPVPVLRFRVSPWPLESQRAEVRLWFNMSDAAPAESFPVDLSNPASIDLAGTGLRVQPRPGNSGDPYQIIVMEQHAEGSKNYPLLVQIRPSPDTALHSFFEDAAKVRHVFSFADREFWKREDPRLFVTDIRQGDVLENWISTGPIEVDLPRR